MKRIIELSIKGVGLALALFAVFGLVADVANQGVFTLKNYNYTKMVIGAVIVGLGFSVPGIVYETTDFSYAVKILIHMGTGCVIFLITGYAVGWFSLAGGIKTVHASDLSKPWNIGIALGRIHASGQENGRKDQ